MEPEVSLAAALAAGEELAAEQQAVLDTRLSLQYMKGLERDVLLAGERQARWARRASADGARRVAAAEAAEAVRRAAADAARAAAAERWAAAAAAGGGPAEPTSSAAASEEDEAESGGAGPPPAPPTASGLPGVGPDELAAALQRRAVVALDVRGAKEFEWGRIKGAAHAPYVLVSGPSLSPDLSLIHI